MSLTLRLLDEMNYKNVLRVMVGLASVILVTMITVVVLARMDLIQGIGLTHQPDLFQQPDQRSRTTAVQFHF